MFFFVSKSLVIDPQEVIKNKPLSPKRLGKIIFLFWCWIESKFVRFIDQSNKPCINKCSMGQLSIL